MITRTMQQVKVNGLHLTYRDTGTGRPVLFLHGTSASLGVWDGVIEMLGEGYRSIALDQRGHGRSSKPENAYAQEDFAQDIVDLVSRLGLADTLLVGHSLGARNAIVAAATAPELFSGVVALDYVPFVEPEVIDELENRVLGGHRSFDTQEAIIDTLSLRYPRTPRQALERRAAYGYEHKDGQLTPCADAHALRHTVDSFRTDFVEAFKTVQLPVVVLRGEHSNIVTREAYQLAKELRPDFNYITLPDCDHYIPEICPSRVAETISAYFPKNLY